MDTHWECIESGAAIIESVIIHRHVRLRRAQWCAHVGTVVVEVIRVVVLVVVVHIAVVVGILVIRRAALHWSAGALVRGSRDANLREGRQDRVHRAK